MEINKHTKQNYRTEYREKLGNRYFKQIIGNKIMDPKLGAYNTEDSSTEHRTLARNKRASGFGRSLYEFDHFDIEVEAAILDADNLPLVFEESFLRNAESFDPVSLKENTKEEVTEETLLEDMSETILDESPERRMLDTQLWSSSMSGSEQEIIPAFSLSSRSSNLYSLTAPVNKAKFVFLSHGFQGSAYDCLKLKHFFAIQRTDIYFHNVKCNEREKTTQKIDLLGEMFAVEVRGILKDFAKNDRIQSISFIGHSQGGLIIRAALPFLKEEFGKYFQAFVTLSTPHLGVASGDSFLVGAGFNLMTSWKKFDALMQMGMKDHEVPTNTFLYQLSIKTGLELFKEVLLISSPQDTYSPYDSSRIQSSKTNSSSGAYSEMVNNLLNKVQAKCLRRVDVCLKFEKASLDRFIGRAAHIALISNSRLIELLSYRYAELL